MALCFQPPLKKRSLRSNPAGAGEVLGGREINPAGKEKKTSRTRAGEEALRAKQKEKPHYLLKIGVGFVHVWERSHNVPGG